MGLKFVSSMVFDKFTIICRFVEGYIKNKSFFPKLVLSSNVSLIYRCNPTRKQNSITSYNNNKKHL